MKEKLTITLSTLAEFMEGFVLEVRGGKKVGGLD